VGATSVVEEWLKELPGSEEQQALALTICILLLLRGSGRARDM
jgi:hypothetical protein